MSGTVYLVILVALFAGIVFWAFGAKRKKRFEDDAKIPFRDKDG
jgi:cytochrome c oxidase cbb3-type subunit 4